MENNNFFTVCTKTYNNFLGKYSRDVFERQQLLVLLSCVALTVAIVSFHFCSIIGCNDPVLLSLSIGLIFCGLIPIILLMMGRLSIKNALGIYGISFVCVQTLKIVYICIFIPQMSFLIPVNEFLSFMGITIWTMCYIKDVPFIMCAIFLASVVTSSILVKNFDVSDFNFIFVCFIVFFCLLVPTMFYNFNKLRHDNEKYKDDERALTAAVKMNRQEINNYLKMSRNDAPSEDDVDYFFSALNDRSKRNLIRAVAMKLASDNSKETKLKGSFPGFTPTELKVSALVLQGKKLSEICILMDKNENNVNTVRSHIRKKLGLKPNEDLRKALMNKI